MLDGLDELMQASKAAQSRFLSEVVEYQERERELGRVVAVIVTSRTVMADRVYVPEGAILVRLEDFDDRQIEDWLSVWNGTNRHVAGFRPLECAAAVAAGELGRQPLLLTMLALYVADPLAGDLLDKLGTSADLYGRLIDLFLTREMTKDAKAPGGRTLDVPKAAAARRRLLSVAAFAMFNRGRQYITEDELEVDLESLRLASPARRADLIDLPLTPAIHTLGRFFFVLKSGEHDRSRGEHNLPVTYEFLHATFGEYLVATEIFRHLARLAQQQNDADADFGYVEPVDDSVLRALLSQQPLVGSIRTLTFVVEHLGVAGVDQERLSQVLRRLIMHVRTSAQSTLYAGYNPSSRDAIDQVAVYTCNLVALLVFIAGPVPVHELCLPTAQPLHSWRSMVRLWRAACNDAEWTLVIRALGTDGTGGSLTVTTADPSTSSAPLSAAMGEARLLGDLATEAKLASGETLWAASDLRDRAELEAHRVLLNAFTMGVVGRGADVRIFEHVVTLLRPMAANPSLITQILLLRAVSQSVPDDVTDSLRRSVDARLRALDARLGMSTVGGMISDWRPYPVRSIDPHDELVSEPSLSINWDNHSTIRSWWSAKTLSDSFYLSTSINSSIVNSLAADPSLPVGSPDARRWDKVLRDVHSLTGSRGTVDPLRESESILGAAPVAIWRRTTDRRRSPLAAPKRKQRRRGK